MRDPDKRRATYERHKERNRERLSRRIAESGRADLNEAARRSKYRSRYGLHFDEYAELLLSQEGACAICSRRDRQLQLDHDHSTGIPRAILCFNCNSGLGQFKDNIPNLMLAIEYLMYHNNKNNNK